MTTQTERPPTYVLGPKLVHSRKPIALVDGTWLVREEEISWGPRDAPPEKRQHGVIWNVSMRCFAVRGTVDRPSITYGTISVGGVKADWRHEEIPESTAEFMARFDSVYGPDAEATWDGESLWTKDRKPQTIVDMHLLLDAVWRNLPGCPPTCTGWWLRPSKR